MEALVATQTQSPGGVLILHAASVRPFPGQPRKRFRDIPRLLASIRRAGQITPIIVTPLENGGYRFELTDGERRLRACLEGDIPVRAVLSDGGQDKFTASVAANFCRQPHDAMEVAAAIRVFRDRGLTQKEIGEIFGKSGCWVSQHESLLKLCPEAQEAIVPQGKSPLLNFGVALRLVPLDTAAQKKIVTWIKRHKPTKAAARNHIDKLLAKTPSLRREQERSRSPADCWSALYKAVNSSLNAFERYETMPHAELAAALDAGRISQRRSLLDGLAHTIETLKTLRASVRKSLGDS